MDAVILLRIQIGMAKERLDAAEMQVRRLSADEPAKVHTAAQEMIKAIQESIKDLQYTLESIPKVER
jgi:hypothetical protein